MTRASDLARLIGAGATINDGTTITTADNTAQLILKSTDADGNDGPLLNLNRDSSSPVDGDLTGRINFNSDNDAGEVTAFSSIRTFMRDASDGTEDGAMQLNHMFGGTEVVAFEIDNDEYVINQGGNDIDFRVESDGNANMLVIDGGNNIASIGRAVNSSSTLAIQNKDDTNNNAIDVYNDNGNRTFSIQSNTSGDAQFKAFKNDGTQGFTLLGDGSVTNPLQPAFFARVQSGSAMTDLAVNTYHTVTFNEEIFDQNADYNNSNYTFTAPVTGRYHFDCRLYLLEVPSNTTYIYFSLVTSNNDILMHINDVDSDQYYDFLQGSVLVDMDASDTAFVRFYQPNGSATTHIHHVSSIFSGHLVA